MTAYEKLMIARDTKRPTASAYIEKLFTEVTELHGDRRFADDPAVIGGIGRLDGVPVTFVATERGINLQDRIARNFGCPKPEGYRKALRLMLQAEKFKRPVVCLVDTSGAYCGPDAEERGQGQAIAENLAVMSRLKTPIITLIIGEGESGGALGIAVADRVYMLENAVYSVISPEGCASILWKDSKYAPEVAAHLRITAPDMRVFGVSERIIPENFEHFGQMCRGIRGMLHRDISQLSAMSETELVNARYKRFRKLGKYSE